MRKVNAHLGLKVSQVFDQKISHHQDEIFLRNMKDKKHFLFIRTSKFP